MHHQQKRATLIFGNGLGMALDPNYFSLEKGLKYAWQTAGVLSPEHKQLICSAFKNATPDQHPSGEEQLDDLQVAIIASEFLKGFGTRDSSWLTQDAIDLPSAFRAYIHQVAIYFHQYPYKLPDNFVNDLCSFIKNTKSHVATLNYDNLLYDTFLKQKVCDGYSGTLIDGYWSTGFHEDNLDRNEPHKHGYYLHLHGSALMVGSTKIRGKDRSNLQPNDQIHIVLTHVKHKPLIISYSQILNEYWKRLNEAIDESTAIVLFGYSGFDEHLNQIIQARSDDKIDRPILVVEWEGSGSYKKRLSFWKTTTKSQNVKLIQMENILEFTDWASCHEVAA